MSEVAVVSFILSIFSLMDTSCRKPKYHPVSSFPQGNHFFPTAVCTFTLIIFTIVIHYTCIILPVTHLAKRAAFSRGDTGVLSGKWMPWFRFTHFATAWRRLI